MSGDGGGSKVTERSGVGSGRRVDLTCFRASLAWPFAIARIFGRYFDISSAVSPVTMEKFMLLISVIKVLGTGQKSAQW